MEYIQKIIICALLIYGGIIDYKKAQIPNIVPIGILFCGLSFDLELLIWRLVFLMLMVVIYFISCLFMKDERPGGDFKLLCSLSFSCGFIELTATLLIVGVLIGIVEIQKLLRKKKLSKRVPLCAYVAPSYIVLWGIFLGVMRM